MAGSEHFIFAEEPSYGTWTTPIHALPVRSVSLSPESPLMIPGETGGGRGRRDGSPGEVAVGGTIETSLYPTIVGRLLKAGFRTVVMQAITGISITSSSVATQSVITTATAHGFKTGQIVTIAGHSGSTPTINGDRVVTVLSATTFSIPVNVSVGGTGGTAASAKRNKMLANDELSILSYSMQKRYKSTVAESVKGSKLNGFTISARTKEFAQLSMDFVAKDATINGSTWSDGSAAPAVVDPVPYAAYQPEAFKFYEGGFYVGGTVALTAGELIVTGGTNKVDFDNIEFEVGYNLGTDGYGVNKGDRTRQTIDEGMRDVNVRFDPNFDTAPTEFYTAWRAGTPGVIKMEFESVEIQTGTKFGLTIVLPRVRYASGALPELNAEYGLKRYTVEGMGATDPSTLIDMGLAIITTEDYSV
jgi:hypothetical protein